MSMGSGSVSGKGAKIKQDYGDGVVEGMGSEGKKKKTMVME